MDNDAEDIVISAIIVSSLTCFIFCILSQVFIRCIERRRNTVQSI